MKRYDPTIKSDPYYYERYAEMEEDATGEYVKLTDYKVLQDENERLKVLIDKTLIPELKNPIEVQWSGEYGNQVCIYCRESLSNVFAKAKEHRKTCKHIPKNKAFAFLSTTSVDSLTSKLKADAVRKAMDNLLMNSGYGMSFSDAVAALGEYANKLEAGE